MLVMTYTITAPFISRRAPASLSRRIATAVCTGSQWRLCNRMVAEIYERP